MLFDLRGRGRRRTIQVIYASLALLMGGGLVFFGIGGATSGGLFDALGGSSNSSSSSDIVQKRVDALEKRVERNPSDAAGWAALTTVHFQIANSEGYDQTTQQYTDKGRQRLAQAASDWERYLALNPPNVDPNVARQMVQAYGPTGLQKYDQATAAQEVVIDAQKSPPAALYAQLSIFAHGAGQTRKATLARDKAVALTPAAQRKQIKDTIQQNWTALDQAKSGTTSGAQGTTTTG
jgi:tetratricopeptide (TPR) repeat protein